MSSPGRRSRRNTVADTSIFEEISRAIGKKSSLLPSLHSPLVLAYIGDTLYDLFVRTYLVSTTTLPAHGLHVKASSLVCAKAQAMAFRSIEKELSPEEMAIFKRGRNAQSATVPKNADLSDYRIATGLEALLGYLYLSGKDERMGQLMEWILHNKSAAETD